MLISYYRKGLILNNAIIYSFILGYILCYEEKTLKDCFGSYMNLYCKKNEKINLVGGNFTRSMATTRPGDCIFDNIVCTVEIKTAKIELFDEFKDKCNGRSNCQIRADWTSIPRCGTTDLMSIVYICIPEAIPPIPPIPPVKTTTKSVTTKSMTTVNYVTEKVTSDQDNSDENEDESIIEAYTGVLVIALIVFAMVVLCFIMCQIPSVKKKFLDDDSKFKKIWTILMSYDAIDNDSHRKASNGISNQGLKFEFRGAQVVKTPMQASIQATSLPHPFEGIYEEIPSDAIPDNVYTEYQQLEINLDTSKHDEDYQTLRKNSQIPISNFSHF